MAEHKHYTKGSMNISEQVKSYALFWTATKWTVIGCILVAVILAVFRTH